MCPSVEKLFILYVWVKKGVWNEIFVFRFFIWISFPRASEYSIEAIVNFYENSRRYSQLYVYRTVPEYRTEIPVYGMPMAETQIMCSNN